MRRRAISSTGIAAIGFTTFALGLMGAAPQLGLDSTTQAQGATTGVFSTGIALPSQAAVIHELFSSAGRWGSRPGGRPRRGLSGTVKGQASGAPAPSPGRCSTTIRSAAAERGVGRCGLDRSAVPMIAAAAHPTAGARCGLAPVTQRWLQRKE
jgi:hypothetical protein